MRKVLFAFLLVVAVFLTGCDPSTDDTGKDKDPSDTIDLVDPEDALKGIDEALILLMDGLFEGEFNGETLSYYFYLPQDVTFVLSLEAEFDSYVVVKDFLTSQIVFEADNSIYGNDTYSVISLDEGEYVVEVSSSDDKVGSFSITIGGDSMFTSIVVDQVLSNTFSVGEIHGYLVEIEEASYYSILSMGDLDLEGTITSIEGEFLAYGDDRNDEDENFEMIIYLEEGTYIIGVAAYSSTVSGTYQLKVEAKTVSHTTTITENTSINDILLAGEKNVVEFDVLSDGNVQLYTQSMIDLFGTVYDSNGDIVTFNDDGSYSSDFYIDVFLESGTYSIEVSGYDEYEAGDYVLFYESTVSTIPEDETFTMDLNSSESGTLGSGIMHTYIITVPSDGNITAYLVSDFDSLGHIKDSLGAVIAVDDDATYENLDFKIENFALSAGTYYIHVEGGSTLEYGDYTLYVTFEESATPPTPEDETFAIDLNSNANGTIISGVIDTYTITVPSEGNITAYLVSDFDSYGSIWNNLGELVTFSDDAISGGDDFKIENYALSAGTYSIDVKGYSSYEYGDYTLYVTFEESATPPDPEDETFAIDLNSNASGTLIAGTVHTYTFTVASDGNITAYLESEFDSFGGIYNSEGDLETENDDGNGNSDFKIDNYALSAGTYSIEIKGYYTSGYGDYTLYVTFEETIVEEPIADDLIYKITASNAESGDYFGETVAVEGNYIVVGAINDHQSSELIYTGAVYLYKANDQAYERIIYASDVARSDRFGTSIAIYNNYNFKIENFALSEGTYSINIEGTSTLQYGDYTLYVTFKDALGDEVFITDLNSTTSGTLSSGIVDSYTFSVSSDVVITAYLVSDFDSYGSIKDSLGDSIVHNDNGLLNDDTYFAVGAPGKNSVYIYKTDDLLYERIISPSDAPSFAQFGCAVAVYGNYIVVGARYDDEKAHGSGAVYIYKLDDILYERKINATDAALDDFFGYSVDVFGNYVAVGAKSSDTNGSESGSVYIYKLDDISFERKIYATDAASQDYFGTAVKITENYIVVGVPGKEAAYIYKIDDLLYERIITASDGEPEARFGFSISVVGDSLLIGAYEDNNNYHTDNGAAYLYSLTDVTYELKISETDTTFNDNYGYGVAISNEYIVIGTRHGNEGRGLVYLYNN